MNFQVVQQFEDPVGVNCNFTHWSEGACTFVLPERDCANYLVAILEICSEALYCLCGHTTVFQMVPLNYSFYKKLFPELFSNLAVYSYILLNYLPH